MGALNVAVTVALSCTPVAVSVGLVTVIMGGVVFAVVPVVNVHGLGTGPAARALPVRSLTPLAPDTMVAVKSVLGAKAATGVNNAVLPTRVTVPATGVAPGPVTVKVVPLTVVGSITVLNVAVIFWLMGTFVAPFTGLVAVIVGGTRFGAAPVVNVDTKFAASELPAALVAPVVTVTV